MRLFTQVSEASPQRFFLSFRTMIAISDAGLPPPRRLASPVCARSFVPSSWKQSLPFGKRGGERRPNLIESKILQTLRSPVWHARSVLDLLLNKHLKETILRGDFPEGPRGGRGSASRLPRAPVGFSCAVFPSESWVGGEVATMFVLLLLARLRFEHGGHKECILVRSAKTEGSFPTVLCARMCFLSNMESPACL